MNLKRAVIYIMIVLAFAIAVVSNYFFKVSERVSGKVTTFSYGYERVDLYEKNIDVDVLKSVCACELWREQIDDVTVIYGYSPRIIKSVSLNGRRVNVMVAIRCGEITVGSPLIKGSY